MTPAPADPQTLEQELRSSGMLLGMLALAVALGVGSGLLVTLLGAVAGS